MGLVPEASPARGSRGGLSAPRRALGGENRADRAVWMRKHAVRIPTDAFERVLLTNAPTHPPATQSSVGVDMCR
eukprot:1045514-Prorocentrum_minimum.AAC.1